MQEEEVESEEDEEELKEIELPEDDELEVEQDMISMYNSSDRRKVNSMRFKGQIGKLPVYALLDSGSTHSFVNPTVIRKLGLTTTQTNPMVVIVANGEKMVTDTKCTALKFSLQGLELEEDLRLLAVQGFDMILGLDWLVSLGPMKIDWGKGCLEFNQDGKDVKLMVKEEKAELKIVKGDTDIEKEVKKGHEVIVAQLFKVSTEQTEPQPIAARWKKILQEFDDVFAEPTRLPPHRIVDHRISLLPDAKPINQRPYRYTHFQKLEIEKIITELLKNSLIQKSHSPYASPILLVKKKDGSWRMCVDYRQMNSQTVKDRFPIPLIEDILDELKGARFFSKIDLKAGYHQIRMCEDDVHKTAFRTHDNHYEFLVMPFGLTNAPATFQSLMNKVFRPHLRKFILVFFDDILVYNKSFEVHQQHLKMTLELFRRNQLYAKLNKCEFGANSLEYLGHVISEEGVSTDPKKVEAMRQWPTPRSVKELRGFLELTGYYRRFVRGYGAIAKPLTDQLKKNAFNWNAAVDKAFEELKLAMINAPVLAMPDFNKSFTIETDASDKEMWAVLMQDKKPIAFMSKSLGIRNQGPSTYEKEFLALLTAVSKWRHYLLGGQFIIKTDQISLKHLLEQRVNHMMQHKGLCKLIGLDYKIEYKKGIENKVADALSRQVTGRKEEKFETLTVTELIPQWVDEIKDSYINDTWIEGLQNKNSGLNSESKFTQSNGLWKYKDKLCIGTNGGWRERLIGEVHNSSQGGHSGIQATYKRVKAQFYWPNMRETIHKYVSGCNTCQQTKGENVKLPGLLQPLPVPEEAWVSISMDFISGLPRSEGKKVIMVIVDRLTKYAHLATLQHPFSASDVARVFLETVYKLHGLPQNIISDRDPIFTSKFWKEIMEKMRVKLKMSTAYHPQNDGQTERVNQCIENYLRSMMLNQPKLWTKWLAMAEYWYNTNFHSALNTTPFKALYGYDPPQLPMGTIPRCSDEGKT
ncbi:polyprotein [Rhynchospora pubera]|uniref:Polyprotein n=1 Tax=Rhynchospora pubera TaxID=906938 RepID=A0AAV8DML4_9POAL|nr:polyprotein [Rhynchospora pubera]